MFKKSLILISLLIVSACASTKPISADNIKRIHNKTVQASNYEYPGVAVIGGLSTGMLGPLAQPLYYKNGRNLVTENNIPNPNTAIKNGVLAKMGEQLNIMPGQLNTTVSNKISATSYADNASIQDLIKTYPNSDYILDINYKNIGIMYRLSGFWYDLHAFVNARLIETSSGNVLGQHTCLYNSKDSKGESYTYDNLTKNHAQLVKDLFSDSVNKCSSEIMNKLF